ncbi:hypothetical protein EVG20_g923 [Dentipellis fragilis]|uniref:AMP-activated protein kinase glycogen-binding domain-containing protein n=1 Tax=Dentipellis fragilis TaxID=205917 RepID=A0A4Y9ZE19_9AGAM|nr:hypothetical protein EVG20_g923 [Dentipellis fragilis]
MPAISTGLSFRLPSFLHCSSSSYLSFQWSSSVRLGRTPSGFEAPVHIPWGDKIAYKFIVDGRWTTTDSQETEADQSGFINNVYTAPPKPSPPTVDAPPEPKAVEVAPASEEPSSETGDVKQNGGVAGAFSQIASSLHERLVAPAVEFASQLESSYEAPTPATEEPPSSLVETAKETVVPVVETVQEPAAQVAPDAEEAEERAAEVTEFILRSAFLDAPTAHDPCSHLQPVPSSDSAPKDPRVLSTEAAALAPTAPISIVPIITAETLPAVEVVPRTSVAPSAPAESKEIVHVFEPSTHTPAQVVEATVAADATEAEVNGTIAVVKTAAAEPPVAEVVATSPAPELAPPVLAAPEGEPKEVIPADFVGAVETAAAPATVEVPASVEKVEEKAEAPEVLAAPSVAAEGTKEVVPVTEPVASPETKEAAAESTPAVTNGTTPTAVTETKAAEPTPAAETKAAEPKTNGSSSTPTNGTVKGKQSRRTSSLVASLTKKERHAFPKEASETGSISSPSRQSSQRKKRDSIFGKIKGIFHHEKEGANAK